MSAEIKIVSMDIDKITPYENNPRINTDAVEYVANSIREFGWKQPIVVDKDGVIVAGHTRYEAGKLLGLKQVPVIIADDLTDEQIKAYRLADNKVAEMAQWDFELLSVELGDIEEFDMSEFGFVDLSEFEPIEAVNTENKKKKEKQVCTCPNCGLVFTPIME